MRTHPLLLLIIFTISISQSLGQTSKIVTQGVIEFEKTINMYKAIEAISGTQNQQTTQKVERYKLEHSQFVKLRSTLSFNAKATLFKPLEPTEQEIEESKITPLANQFNIVYKDLSTDTLFLEKNIFGKTFNVKDVAREIKWKLTSETRNIAGYDCKRANGVILDSIYIVAFYAKEIPISSGPETFMGLPGMILGIAFPYEHVTWFATNVKIDQAVDIKLPKIQTYISDSELLKQLRLFTQNLGTKGIYLSKILQIF
jgi:GLPGLI family protein